MFTELLEPKISSRIKRGSIALLLLMVLCLSVTQVRAENILFISADNPANAVDVPIIEYLEGKGHIVTVLADQDVATQGEALALQNDAIIASESSGSGNVAALPSDIPVPFVCLEYYAWDDFGMVTGGAVNGTSSGTTVTIVAPGHYLAAGLTGDVEVLTTSGLAIADSTGATIGSEAVVIAEGPGFGPIIFVYEKGSKLADGSVAAEIRLGFGFGLGSYASWTENTYKLLEAVVNTALDLASPTTNATPSPAEEDVSRDVVLSWAPATEEIVKYELFFGTRFEDVNSATAGTPLDVTSYDPGRLEFGQTYYWRVDGITDSETLKAPVWSFTVEPLTRPIPSQAISATASSSEPDVGPEMTIDRSGLDANDLHSNDEGMWLTLDAPSAWIQYEFNHPYQLHQMLVWNFNGSFISVFGMKDVTIEHSTDGVTWSQFNTVFAQAPGKDGYASNTTVEFGDVMAKIVKITTNSNYASGFDKFGLSEVQFLAIPVSARLPVPADDANEVAVDATLSWRAGREAATHNVYVSTDEQAVSEGTAPMVTVTEAAYSTPFKLGSTYYWRVDEVNDTMDPSVWPGDTWSFATKELIVLDDFESYNDTWNHIIFQAWVDGFGWEDPNGSSLTGNGTGAGVGYWPPPTVEDVNVYDGRQSMPLGYGFNEMSISETTYTLPKPQLVEAHGIKTLSLQFFGQAANVPGQLFVKINGTKVSDYPGSQDDMKQPEWHSWTIDLAGITRIETMTIGVTGGSGTVFIDAIYLTAD